MKTLPTLTSSLALSALLLTAHAQTPASATQQDNPTPATPTTKGAIGTKGSKTLGSKMVQKSKPTDTVIPQKVKKQ